MNEDRLAQAWPHIRSAVEILLYGSELQTQPQAPVATEDHDSDRRDALVRHIRELLNDTVPAEPSPVRVTGDKIPGGVSWGTWSQIARELGVTPQHVRQVALGMHVSKRVAEALLRHGIEPVQKVRIGGVA
jgi:hypothetical protein